MAYGALCHIDSSLRTAYGYDERIEVFGSKGMVQSMRKPTREVALYTGTKVITDGLLPDWFERFEPSFARPWMPSSLRLKAMRLLTRR